MRLSVNQMKEFFVFWARVTGRIVSKEGRENARIVRYFGAILGCVLPAAGLAKVRDRAAFARSIGLYAPIPETWAAKISLTIPAGEIVVGLCLFIPPLAPWPALAAMALIALFTVAILLALKRGLANTLCGCCGKTPKTSLGINAVLRNMALIALAVLATRSPVLEQNAPVIAASAMVMWLTGFAIARATRAHHVQRGAVRG